MNCFTCWQKPGDVPTCRASANRLPAGRSAPGHSGGTPRGEPSPRPTSSRRLPPAESGRRRCNRRRPPGPRGPRHGRPGAGWRRSSAGTMRHAGRHRDRPHRPPLPLQEEGPLLPLALQDAEGVGPHRVEAVVMAEKAGRPPGRVKVHGLPTLRPGLICQHRQEPVDGLGVFLVAQQLAAAGAVDVAPGQRTSGFTGAALQRRRASPTAVRSRRASAANPLSERTRQRCPSVSVTTTNSNSLSRSNTW